jgi:membrane protein
MAEPLKHRDRPGYDRRVTAPPAPARQRPGDQLTPQPVLPAEPHTRHGASFYYRAFLRARGEVRLTALAIWRGIIGVYNSDDLTFAASIAYYSLLSLFPFFLLLISVIAGVTSSETDRQEVLGFVLRYFPRQFDFVTSQLNSMQDARLRLGVAGSILMVWAAMGVFGAITSAVNHAWGVEKQPSYFKHKMISFVMLAMASLLLMAALALVSAVNVVGASWFAAVLERYASLQTLQGFVVKWASTFAFIFVVGLIFYFVPNAQVRFRDVWVGAVVTGLAWRGALAAFSWYVRDLTRFDQIHGSIGAVVVFLIWVYTSAVILLYGVEVTAANARIRRRRPDEIPAAPAPRI